LDFPQVKHYQSVSLIESIQTGSVNDLVLSDVGTVIDIDDNSNLNFAS